MHREAAARLRTRQGVADRIAKLARLGLDAAARALGPGQFDREPGLAYIEIRHVVLGTARSRDRPGHRPLPNDLLAIGRAYLAGTREELELALVERPRRCERETDRAEPVVAQFDHVTRPDVRPERADEAPHQGRGRIGEQRIDLLAGRHLQDHAIADITLSWCRLRCPAWLARYAGPTARKMSATRSVRTRRQPAGALPAISAISRSSGPVTARIVRVATLV